MEKGVSEASHLKSFKFLSSFGSVFLPARFKTPCFKLYVHVPEASGKLPLTEADSSEGDDVCPTRHGLDESKSAGGSEGTEAWVCEISCIMQTEQ